MPKAKFIAVLILMLSLTSRAQSAETPVVLELFTSQSCSSCPPANALLKQISQNDPSLLALSYHVNYWDYLSWKDTYSSQIYSDRQTGYTELRGGGGDFTPELVVQGNASMNGADSNKVSRAIQDAKKTASQFSIIITPKNGQLEVTLKPVSGAPAAFEVWQIYYDRDSIVHIGAGENGGRTLETINNVTSVKKLDKPTSQFTIEPPKDYAVAILVQAQGQGRILGAAAYIKR